MKYFRIILAGLLLLIIARRADFPLGTLRNPDRWVIPAPFGKVETKEFSTNFNYHVPDDNQVCFDTDIPCVTYVLDNVILRGSDLREGFKVDKMNKDGGK
jgi:hypothetical protein